MKHLLLTTIAAVVLVGCSESAPDISIHDAAEDGNLEAVKQHLADGTDVDATNKSGRTPLHFAASFGHKEVAELLIAKGADVNAKDPRGTTPLHLFLPPHLVHRFVEVPDADVNAKDNRGVTPLHHAASGGHKEIVELLIAKGAGVNAQTDGGRTPLDFAVFFNHPKTADLLRKHGGKTGEELKGGEPVAEAAQPEPPTAKAPDISIHSAATEGNIEAVEQLLAAGTNVNAKDDDGWTPLDWAIDLNRTEIVDLLRKHGGKTKGWLEAGDSIHIAAFRGNIEAVKQHLAAGADVNAERREMTPLHWAASEGHNEVVKLLITKGADVNTKSGRWGWAPLHYAAHGGHKETAELLIAKGADVNARRDTGDTPLHVAALVGRKEVAELLITEDADVNAKILSGVLKGKTPLDFAIRRHPVLNRQGNHSETADLLRKHGGKTGEELK